MANIFSVENLARNHADAVLGRDNIPEPTRRRREYDFKVTGFNVATVAMIVLAALAVFTGSILIYALALLAYNVRSAFLHSIQITGLENGEGLLERIDDLNPNMARQEMINYLGIENAEWLPVHSQILQFKLWMNCTPAVQPMVAHPQQPAG